MKKFSLAVITAIAVILINQAVVSAAEISATLSSKILGNYVGGNGILFHNRPVVQTDLFISLPKGFYIDLWHSAGLDGTSINSDGGDEIDYTVGWAGPVGPVNLNINLAYWDLYSLGSKRYGDIIAASAEICKSIQLGEHSLTPYVKTEFHFPIKMGVRNGYYVYGGIVHSYKLLPEVTFSQKTYVVYDSGVYGKDSGLLGQYHTGLIWQVSKHIAIEGLIRLSAPLTTRDSRNAQITPGIGVIVSF